MPEEVTPENTIELIVKSVCKELAKLAEEVGPELLADRAKEMGLDSTGLHDLNNQLVRYCAVGFTHKFVNDCEGRPELCRMLSEESEKLEKLMHTEGRSLVEIINLTVYVEGFITSMSRDLENFVGRDLAARGDPSRN